MQAKDLVAAVSFTLLYTVRLLYQQYLLKHRSKAREQHGWSELLLVIVPKNLLVVATPFILASGVPWNSEFILGSAIFCAGISLRLVALRDLGAMYSLNIEIRPGHSLVTSGVFGIVRHPLYLAYILDTIGIVLFLQRWYFWGVVLAVSVGWAKRIPESNASLRQHFGKRFDDYSHRVPSLNLFSGIYRKLHRGFSDRAKRIANASKTKENGLEGPKPVVRDHDELSHRDRSEIDIHIAEYKALSDFQREAKALFIRIGTYHNTGIVLVGAWLIQNSTSPTGIVATLQRNNYLVPLVYVLPVVNSVLMIGMGYQIYSFFCVALHFQKVRHRLISLLGYDVLGYEDKFGKTPEKHLTQVLDVVAGVMWFLIPVTMALGIAIVGPLMAGFPTRWAGLAYGVGTFFSAVSISYVLGVALFMYRIRGRWAFRASHDEGATRTFTSRRH